MIHQTECPNKQVDSEDVSRETVAVQIVLEQAQAQANWPLAHQSIDLCYHAQQLSSGYSRAQLVKPRKKNKTYT